jgi:SAM-dependent methyltransferase
MAEVKSSGIATSAKRYLHAFFGLIGLRISRLPKAGALDCYGSGRLSPLEENSQEINDRFYSDLPALKEYYNEHRLHFYEVVSNQIRESGLSLDGKDVIDVGCGTGHLLAALGSWSKPLNRIGCDFSEAGVKLSRARYSDCQFFVHDIYDALPGCYDIVICTEVLEHLQRPFIAIRQLVAGARPNGTVVITVPNGRMDTAIEHLNFWSPESWKMFLERECPDCDVKTSTLLENRYNFALLQRLPKACGRPT